MGWVILSSGTRVLPCQFSSSLISELAVGESFTDDTALGGGVERLNALEIQPGMMTIRYVNALGDAKAGRWIYWAVGVFAGIDRQLALARLQRAACACKSHFPGQNCNFM